MIRNALLGLSVAAATFVAVPAGAATYKGTLQGTITSGSAGYSNYIDHSSSSMDLVGMAITIDFTADVQYNYTDPVGGDFYPKFVVDTVVVTIPAPAPLGKLGSYSTDLVYYYPVSDADFTGNAQSGTFKSYGYSYPDPDFPANVVFSFAGAGPVAGALTGSGTASAGYFVPYSGEDDSYSITYSLTSGFVTATGTPEPASWALMILGFGAIGAALRRQRMAGRIAMA